MFGASRSMMGRGGGGETRGGGYEKFMWGGVGETRGYDVVVECLAKRPLVKLGNGSIFPESCVL